MSSRGTMVAGSSGADYLHREQVAAHYQASVVNKSRLRWCVWWHCALLATMLLKLSADVLDRLDIFILELEELQVPPPLWWEWAWALGAAGGWWALGALRRNSAPLLRRHAAAVLLLGVLPALVCLVQYLDDVWTYLAGGDLAQVQMWQGYCYGLLWYWWVAAALQLHAFQLLFARRLAAAWRGRKAA